MKPDELGTVLSERIREEYFQANSLDPNEYRASEVIYCKRKPILRKLTGTLTTPNGKMLSGTIFHSIIPIIVKDIPDFKNVLLEKELYTTVKSKYGEILVTGHCDGIDDDFIYEFKYTAKNAYTTTPDQYLRQSNLYSYMSGKNSIDHYRDSRIILVNSDTLSVRVYEHEYDSTLVEDILSSIIEMHEAIHSGELPEGPRYGFECMFCDMAEECFKRQGKEKEFKDLLKVKEAIKWKKYHATKKKNKEKQKVITDLAEGIKDGN